MTDEVVNVTLGDEVYIIGPSIDQYSTGILLTFDGAELPESYEVHFSKEKHGMAKKAEITNEGVVVPDEYFLTKRDLYAWIFVRNGKEYGYTIYSIQFPVVGADRKAGDGNA